MKKRVIFLLPELILKQIDELCVIRERSRAYFIRTAIKQLLVKGKEWEN